MPELTMPDLTPEKSAAFLAARYAARGRTHTKEAAGEFDPSAWLDSARAYASKGLSASGDYLSKTPTARNALFGAGAGALAGLGSSLAHEPEEGEQRHPWLGALAGGVGGAAAGAGFTLARDAARSMRGAASPSGTGGGGAAELPPRVFEGPGGQALQWNENTPPEVRSRIESLARSERLSPYKPTTTGVGLTAGAAAADAYDTLAPAGSRFSGNIPLTQSNDPEHLREGLRGVLSEGGLKPYQGSEARQKVLAEILRAPDRIDALSRDHSKGYTAASGLHVYPEEIGDLKREGAKLLNKGALPDRRALFGMQYDPNTFGARTAGALARGLAYPALYMGGNVLQHYAKTHGTNDELLELLRQNARPISNP